MILGNDQIERRQGNGKQLAVYQENTRNKKQRRLGSHGSVYVIVVIQEGRNKAQKSDYEQGFYGIDLGINSFIKEHKIVIPQNLSIFPRQSNIHQFYNNASILLNLSNPNKVIETFGMTALEGMSAALPVIVPTVGGITEFVEDGVNGYKFEKSNEKQLSEKIRKFYNLSIEDKRKMKRREKVWNR